MNSHCSCGGKMHPQVDSRTHFTWRCEKCGETVTQGKRLKRKSVYELAIEDPKRHCQLVEEEAVLSFTNLVCELLEKEDVSRTELASRLECSRTDVTQLLDARDVGLKRMARSLFCLGQQVQITCVPLTPAVKLRTPEVDRLCVGCKHFEIDFGYVGEDGDPGGMGSLDCLKKQFETDYSPTEGDFHKVIRTAQTCDKFEVRAVS